MINNDALEIRAKNLKKSYGSRNIIKDVSLSIKVGEIVGLLGPNGSGKTTSFYMIVGLIRPDAGAIYIGNEMINNLPMHKRAKKGIGYLPQDISIFRRLTVKENIMAPLELKKKSY